MVLNHHEIIQIYINVLMLLKFQYLILSNLIHLMLFNLLYSFLKFILNYFQDMNNNLKLIFINY